jgi:hypothetical protein
MARLVHHTSYPAVSFPRSIDLGRVFLVLVQLVVLGGIGLFIAMAVINSILGAPASEPVYRPY